MTTLEYETVFNKLHQRGTFRTGHLAPESQRFSSVSKLTGRVFVPSGNIRYPDQDLDRARHFTDLHKSIFSLPQIKQNISSLSNTGINIGFTGKKARRPTFSTSQSFPLGPLSYRRDGHTNSPKSQQKFRTNTCYSREDITEDETIIRSGISSLRRTVANDVQSDFDNANDTVVINLFPNVGTSSAMSSEIISPSFTSPRHMSTSTNKKNKKSANLKNKKMEKTKQDKKDNVTKQKIRESLPKRKRVNYAVVRKHDRENARRHPVRKQFFYSEALTIKLQKLIPRRINGGNLKLTLRRNGQGEVIIPASPVQVMLETLVTSDTGAPSPPPEGNLKWRGKIEKVSDEVKAQKRVRFKLPPEILGVESSRKKNNIEIDQQIDHEKGSKDTWDSESTDVNMTYSNSFKTDSPLEVNSSVGLNSSVMSAKVVSLRNIFKTETDGVKRTNIDDVMYVDDGRKSSDGNINKLSQKMFDITLTTTI